jgi:hypothetical protein
MDCTVALSTHILLIGEQNEAYVTIIIIETKLRRSLGLMKEKQTGPTLLYACQYAHTAASQLPGRKKTKTPDSSREFKHMDPQRRENMQICTKIIAVRKW